MNQHACKSALADLFGGIQLYRQNLKELKGNPTCKVHSRSYRNYPSHSMLMWDRNLLNCPNGFTRSTLFVRRARYDAYDYVIISVYFCFVNSTATMYTCLSTPTTVLIYANTCALRWQMSLSMTQAQTPTRVCLTYDIKRIKVVTPFNKLGFSYIRRLWMYCKADNTMTDWPKIKMSGNL